MDLTPSQPVTPGDEPLGEPPAQTTNPDAGGSTAVGPSVAMDAHSDTQAEPLQHDDGTASRSSKEIGGKKFRVGTADDYVPFRRRAKRRRRLMVTVAVVVVLIGAGAYGVGSLIGSPSQAPTASGCAKADAAADGTVNAAPADAQTVTVAGQLPAAAQIKLNVYNSTGRRGLAATTATALKQRGFTIGKVTNDPLKANLTGAAEVRGAAVNTTAMRVVAAEVPGSAMRTDSRTDNTVDLVLGAGFTALASPDQVSAALKQVQQTSQTPRTQAAPQKAVSECS